MIARISGIVIDTDEKSIIVETGGIGYQIFMVPNDMPLIGEKISLFTFFVVREDVQELYGFTNNTSKELFKLLTSISGIGPRSALGILSLASTNDLISYIDKGDASYLTKVSGIGKKTAEKIILELKDKVSGMVSQEGMQSVTNDTIDALVALGYSTQQIRNAISNLPADTNMENTQDVIRAVLKDIRSK